jgi:bifunctional NMN adenylyltransferase/nudix hydrolase
MRTGVVIGRFQVPYLHDGHIELLEYANRYNDQVVVVLGEPSTKLTTTNPLSFDIRKNMIKDYFPDFIVVKLNDHKSDKVWSENLDNLIGGFDRVTLYGSRDSFINCYSGEFPCYYIEHTTSKSGSEVRKGLKNYDKVDYINDSHFRSGIIHAIENKYPTAYPTIDFAVTWKGKVLLGRKPGLDKWCFVGGFVDPTDKCLEDAALRELSEEVPGMVVSDPKYVCSHKVNDWRYKGTTDGIITTFFHSIYITGEFKAGDDLEQVGWFDMENGEAESAIQQEHLFLLSSLYKLDYEKEYNY